MDYRNNGKVRANNEQRSVVYQSLMHEIRELYITVGAGNLAYSSSKAGGEFKGPADKKTVMGAKIYLHDLLLQAGFHNDEIRIDALPDQPNPKSVSIQHPQTRLERPGHAFVYERHYSKPSGSKPELWTLDKPIVGLYDNASVERITNNPRVLDRSGRGAEK